MPKNKNRPDVNSQAWSTSNNGMSSSAPPLVPAPAQLHQTPLPLPSRKPDAVPASVQQKAAARAPTEDPFVREDPWAKQHLWQQRSGSTQAAVSSGASVQTASRTLDSREPDAVPAPVQQKAAAKAPAEDPCVREDPWTKQGPWQQRSGSTQAAVSSGASVKTASRTPDSLKPAALPTPAQQKSVTIERFAEDPLQQNNPWSKSLQDPRSKPKPALQPRNGGAAPLSPLPSAYPIQESSTHTNGVDPWQESDPWLGKSKAAASFASAPAAASQSGSWNGCGQSAAASANTSAHAETWTANQAV